MTEIPLKPRLLSLQMPAPASKRLAILTGARQTGKTTLSKQKYAGLNYVNLDAPENREVVHHLPTAQWGQVIGNSIIDEAHKEPSVFEKVKYAYDEGQISFTVLTGSSQILLLRKVRESLAGRAYFYEIWPLLQCELSAESHKETSLSPLLAEIVSDASVTGVLSSLPKLLLNEHDSKYRLAENHMLTWGGMPALLQIPESERWAWLRNYGYTYLERDLTDLSRLPDLMPFRKFQRLSAFRSAMLLNYSELARNTGISVDTAKRYLQYLQISYQTVLLQPYYKNLTSRVVKTPKVYWIDVGIWRQLTGFRGQLNGQIYETMVTGEIIKWMRTVQCDGELYFYRTKSGLEVDILLELPQGCIGMEIKARSAVSDKDTRRLKLIAEALSSNWLGGIVIYLGDTIKPLASPDIWAVPSRRLFQPPLP